MDIVSQNDHSKGPSPKQQKQRSFSVQISGNFVKKKCHTQRKALLQKAQMYNRVSSVHYLHTLSPGQVKGQRACFH